MRGHGVGAESGEWGVEGLEGKHEGGLAQVLGINAIVCVPRRTGFVLRALGRSTEIIMTLK